MGLFHDFFTGKLHVYYGLVFLFGLSVWQILQCQFLWLFVLVICSGILVDLYIHDYKHLPTRRK
jgi:hypothetical protein